MFFFFNIYTGQSDLYENASSGDTSNIEDIIFDIQKPAMGRQNEHSVQQTRQNPHQDKDYHALWSNSSRSNSLSTSYATFFFFPDKKREQKDSNLNSKAQNHSKKHMAEVILVIVVKL